LRSVSGRSHSGFAFRITIDGAVSVRRGPVKVTMGGQVHSRPAGADEHGMRSVPTTPLAIALWLVGIVSCVIMLAGFAWVGLGLLTVAAVLYVIGWLAGLR
jgi:hypothetical protein